MYTLTEPQYKQHCACNGIVIISTHKHNSLCFFLHLSIYSYKMSNGGPFIPIFSPKPVIVFYPFNLVYISYSLFFIQFCCGSGCSHSSIHSSSFNFFVCVINQRHCFRCAQPYQICSVSLCSWAESIKASFLSFSFSFLPHGYDGILLH